MGTFLASRVDIKKLDDHFELMAELLGAPKEDMQIHGKGGILTLEAETQQDDKEEKDGKVIRQERCFGEYMRSFNLGGDVEESDFKANFVDGVLKLTAPKLVEKPAERRRISAE